MRDFFPTLRGNERLRQQLGERILQGTMAHAYLIQGERGTGKKTLAHLLAAAFSCEAKHDDKMPLPCGECDACRKILSDNTPDLTVIDRGENATIGIEVIRQAKEDMYLSSIENERKVYIICEANKMSVAAQNALLIVLEEPPRDVVIILLCEDSSFLLPTVRSRVQTLRMSLFSQEQLSAFLADHPEANHFRRESDIRFYEMLASAGGSFGRALELLEKRNFQNISEQRACVIKLLSVIHSRIRFSALYEALLQLGTKRTELLDNLKQLLLAVRDLILLKRDENVALCFFSNREAARERGELLSFRTLFAIYDATQEAILQLNKNANVGVVTTSLADALRAAPLKQPI